MTLSHRTSRITRKFLPEEPMFAAAREFTIERTTERLAYVWSRCIPRNGTTRSFARRTGVASYTIFADHPSHL
jgi:hypothetical protein